MRKFIISLTVIAALGFITQSCFDGLNDFTYQGPPVVEFSNLTHSAASWTSVGSYWSASFEVWHQEDIDLTVALVGPHAAQDRTIGFYVADQLYRDTDANKLSTEQPGHDEWVLMESTGQSGVDYTFGTAGIATIPANSSFGNISLELTPTEVTDIYIVLEEAGLAPSENYKFFRLTAIPVFLLELDADPAEGGTVSGDGVYQLGAGVQIEAKVEYGWEFVEWTGDTDVLTDVTAALATFDMPADDVNLTANFNALPLYEVTLAANDDDWGSVEGAGEYVEDDEITITATPAEGYVFVQWTGDITHIEDATAATTTLTVPAAAVSLTAEFAPAP